VSVEDEGWEVIASKRKKEPEKPAERGRGRGAERGKSFGRGAARGAGGGQRTAKTENAVRGRGKERRDSGRS